MAATNCAKRRANHQVCLGKAKALHYVETETALVISQNLRAKRAY
jgi:hypothetical protein